MNHAGLGRLTVSRLLKGASAIMATGLLAVGGFGLYTSIGLAKDAQQLFDSGHALSLSGRADMMHDAIRGDVAVALLAAGSPPPASSASSGTTGAPTSAPISAPISATAASSITAEAEAALQTHGQTLQSALAELKTLGLDPALQTKVADAEASVASYLLQAQQTLRRAAVDPAGARSQFATFDRSYQALEAPLAAISEGVEQLAADRKVHADGLRQSAIASIAVSTLLTIVAVLLTCGWISGQIQRPLQHAVRSAEEVANGRLGTEVPVAGPQDTQRLLAALNHMNGRLHALVHGIRQDSEGVSVASAEIAQGGQDLSQRTERQSAALEEAASTMSELGHTVRRNAEQAHEAAGLAGQAQAVAGRSQAMVEQVVQTMQTLRDGSQRMVEIVSLIDSIAFQTNILALNAAVEAARAGEQGRGFAVVAGEVRTLATRSAEAAKEIRTLITSSLEQVQAGTQRAGETGQTMQALLGSVQRVAGLIDEIDHASRQQTADIDGMVQVVNELDAMTQQNAALVEESAAAAHSLSDQADRLRQQVQGFELTGSAPAALLDPAPTSRLRATAPSTPANDAPALALNPGSPLLLQPR